MIAFAGVAVPIGLAVDPDVDEKKPIVRKIFITIIIILLYYRNGRRRRRRRRRRRCCNVLLVGDGTGRRS